MYRLKRKLKEWQQAELISPEQIQAILAHERHDKKSYFSHGFMGLGVLVVGMGIIALVASHWDQISSAVKLLVDFSLLLTLSAIIFYTRQQQNQFPQEGLIFGFMLLCLASIGLIAQIYHLSGDVENSFLFWCAMTLPIALYAEKFFIPFVWVSVFLTSALAKTHDVVVQIYGYDACVFTMVLTVTPIVIALFSILLHYGKQQARYWHKAMLFWAMSLGFMMVLVSDVLIGQKHICGNELYAIPTFLLASLSLTWVHFSRVFNNIQRTLLTIVLALYLLMNHFAFFVGGVPLLGPLFTILIFSLLAIYCASMNYRAWFHFFTFVIATRFFFVYLEHFYGLASTGIGLIIAGCLIILLVYAWRRYSRVLLQYMEDAISD